MGPKERLGVRFHHERRFQRGPPKDGRLVCDNSAKEGDEVPWQDPLTARAAQQQRDGE